MKKLLIFRCCSLHFGSLCVCVGSLNAKCSHQNEIEKRNQFFIRRRCFCIQFILSIHLLMCVVCSPNFDCFDAFPSLAKVNLAGFFSSLVCLRLLGFIRPAEHVAQKHTVTQYQITYQAINEATAAKSAENLASSQYFFSVVVLL